MFLTSGTEPKDPAGSSTSRQEDWRNRSELPWIRDGLQDLRRVIGDRGIRSIALPLSLRNGGLDWNDVRSEIESPRAAQDVTPRLRARVEPLQGP